MNGNRASTATRTATASRAAADGQVVAHLTPAERAARGKAARTEVPRSGHAGFEPLPGRRDPIAILEEQAATRVPELVPIRYGRMVSSPFAFFRGAAAVMAADLAGTPRSGLWVQACGDAHLSNFGIYRSPDRRLVFDINDFDETLPGPWEWDVKRLTASLVIAGRDNGFDARQRATVVLQTARSYRDAMNQFAAMRNLDVWYSRVDVENVIPQFGAGVAPARLKRTQQLFDKALGADSLQAYAKLTTMVDGKARFISSPPLVVPADELVTGEQREHLEEFVRGALRTYRRTLPSDRRHLLENFNFAQLARKVVGVGSVGTRAWMALMLGRDDADPLLLQVKEAQRSVLEPYTGRSEYTNSGQRVVAGQHLMQATSDIFLGWLRVRGVDGVERDFYVRQLRDGKASAPIEVMVPPGMAAYGRLCGWTLARAHARSGDRIAIASYLGRGDIFDRAVLDFSEAYADQNARDHAALADAVRTGRVKATSGI